MPFNSPYNDYMYVIDEFNNLGWFASDRYQPADSVCIYIFIPNETRHVYDFENDGEEQVRRAAMIHSIGETWGDKEEVRKAKQRLSVVTYQKPVEEQKRDFEFVIDDNSTYYYLTDFKSAEAKRLFTTWQQECKEQKGREDLLEGKRTKYARGTATQKNSLKDEILELERAVEEHELALRQLELSVRNTEQGAISK